MASNKLKFSLITVSVVALGLAGLSFFVSDTERAQAPAQIADTAQALLEIDFGDGRTATREIEVDGVKNLFQLMQEKFVEEKMDFEFKSYSGLGELVTKIGDTENGDEGKYWQFWVNDGYATVGVSAYVVKAGDKIKWKFTDEIEQE